MITLVVIGISVNKKEKPFPLFKFVMPKPNKIIVHSQILLLLLITCSLPSSTAMASSSEATVHIVYTEKPDALIDPRDHHIKTLSSVLGSEDAAKESLLYVYNHAATGFSAKLTPEQVQQISNQPGVLQVVPSQTLQLHSGHGHGIGKMQL